MKQRVRWILLQKMKFKDINSLNNKTIIMISHRMNTLKHCDKIYLIDNGKIIDEETLINLMRNIKKF